MSIISVTGLEKKYGNVHALKGISFDVGRGEIFALLGPNGSGKTTTVGEIARLLGDLAGRPELIRLGSRPHANVDAPRVVADVRRLKNEVGWAPAYGLTSGLTETLQSSGVWTLSIHVGTD